MMPTIQETQRHVYAALDTLHQQDAFLLRSEAGKQPIVHRLAVHLEALFPHWQIDCGYDLEGYPAIADTLRPLFRDEWREGQSLYPDLIIHRRGRKQNLLLIEVQKSSTLDPDSLRFAKQKTTHYFEYLNYKLALYLTLDTAHRFGQPYIAGWHLGRLARYDETPSRQIRQKQKLHRTGRRGS